MERIQKFNEIRRSLMALRNLRSKLKQNFEALNQSFDAEKFASLEVLESTPKNLLDFTKEELFCFKTLKGIFKDYPENFLELEEFLDKEERRIFEASVFGRAEKFLYLIAKNPRYQKDLVRHQKKLRVMLEKNSYDAKAEAIAEPYANFIDAMFKPATGEKISMLGELMKHFDNNFIGAGLFDHDLIFPSDDEPIQEVLEETLPEESDFVKSLREQDALLTEQDFEPWKELFSFEDITRDKDFSSKRFKSELKEITFLKPFITLIASAGYVSYSSFTTNIFTPALFESAASSLCSKGYLQKFSFEKLGSFYGLTKAFVTFLRTDNGKRFIHSLMKGHNVFVNAASALEPEARLTLSGAVYFHLHAQEIHPDKSFVTAQFYSQAFRAKFHAGKKRGLLLGCFWDNFDDCDKFLKRLRQYLQNIDKSFECVLVAGLTFQHAEKILNALQMALANDFPWDAAIYFYAVNEDNFYSSKSGEVVSAEEIFKISIDNDTLLEEDSRDSEFSVDEPSNDEPINEEILSVVREMILDKKFYCATAYLKAKSKFGGSEEFYRRIALALNEPLLEADYSSEEVLTLFAKNKSIFDEALITAAALRTFFYNRVEFDLSIPALYDRLRSFELVTSNKALEQLIRRVKDFKLTNNKGVEFFAKYLTKDECALKARFVEIVQEAEEYFTLFFEGNFRGETNHTVALTKLALFIENEEFREAFELLKTPYEKISIDTIRAVKTFLAKNFILKKAVIDKTNLDKEKLKKQIDDCWRKVKAKNQKGSVVGCRRSNLFNNLERGCAIMCDWVNCVENLSGDSHRDYHEQLFSDMAKDADEACQNLDKRISGRTLDSAGLLILDETLKEISEQLKGNFNPCEHDFFYIGFLLGSDVVLDEKTLLPNLELNISDGSDEALCAQIESHAKQNDLPTVEERIKYIFENGGDDFGSAKILDSYLQKSKGVSFISEHYDLEKIINAAGIDAKRDHEEFPGRLVFAQIHGQLYGLPEGEKEKILQIVDSCYEYAQRTSNYGVFFRVKKFWEDKVAQNVAEIGKSLETELQAAVESYKKNGDDSDRSELEESYSEIKKLIASGILTKARECIRELSEGKLYIKLDDKDEDTFSRFIANYDDCYKRVQNIGTSLYNLLSTQLGDKKNKFYDLKEALLKSWLPNGMPDSDSGRERVRERVASLLELLGFDLESVMPSGEIDSKSLSYIVKLKKSFKIRHSHPIAAFGSEAESDKLGFRVTCLFGQFPQENLIDHFKKIDNGNTIILLDHALKLTVRRQLARALKLDKALMHVFALIDRVIIMYLIKNCSEQIKTKRINDTLMALIMPFSRCQPYIWEPRIPLPPEIFIGRENAMNEVKNPTGVNIVYGGRQLGKSALLKMACREIDGKNNQRAIFVELLKKDYKEAALITSRELSDASFFIEPLETEDWDVLTRAIKRRLSSDEPTKITYLHDRRDCALFPWANTVLL